MTETKPSNFDIGFSIFAAALAVIVLADCGPQRAGAQQRVGPGNDLGLALGMLYVKEADWEGWADYPALYWAIHHRAEARDLTPIQHLRAYSSSIWVPRLPRQIRIAQLRRDVRASIDTRWWPVLELADGHIEDPPPNPCDGMVEHWGGPGIPIDRERADEAVRLGRWRELDCGDTHNEYYAVLRRARTAL